MEPIYLTRFGYQKLADELEQLKAQRKKISQAIGEARLQGDISENAEYDAAKEAQAHNEARMLELEDKLAAVRIIEDQNIPSDRIYIGAIVTLKDLDSEEELRYMLVSPEEANYEENKLSIFAPVGQSLMGHAVDDEIIADVPAGTLRYRVMKIERPT